MTTNTNLSRTAARFFVADKPAFGAYPIIDRVDGKIVVNIKGRATARDIAKVLTLIDPAPRVIEVKAETPSAPKVRTSHADCAHASSKLARAICRREATKANAPT